MTLRGRCRARIHAIPPESQGTQRDGGWGRPSVDNLDPHAEKLARAARAQDPRVDRSVVDVIACAGVRACYLECHHFSTEINRHEDLDVVTSHEKRDVLAGSGHQFGQLFGACHRRVVHRDDDISGLDTCSGGRPGGVLY